MLITESFVMLNYPKTGSTFARKVIRDLYAREPRRWFRRRYCKELILPNIRHAGPPDQHGCYSQIPRRYRNREVFSIVRSPYDRFLSGFEFRYWAVNPMSPMEAIRERFPAFPELTLDEYVDFLEFEYPFPVGPQTEQFLQLFSRELPKRLFELPTLQRAIDRLASVTFISQTNLNDELAAFLRRKGFPEERTAFIERHAPVNVTEGKRPDRNGLWTTKALSYVRERELLLFEILGAHGFHFDGPRAMAA